MTDKQPEPAPTERILILAPTGRDSELAASALREAGLTSVVCADVEMLCAEIARGADLAMITEEALTAEAMRCLREELERQPAWSDLPLIIFTSKPSADLHLASLDVLGPRANTTLLERPIRVRTMITAARAALRARRRQYEIRILLQELETRVRERDNFLAMLSHELRNPLTAITLAVDALPSDHSERDIVVRQTHHLKKLVDDLLDIGRVTSGKISLQKTAVDLADIVEHCVDSHKRRTHAHKLTVTVHNAAEHAWVSGDPVRLEQIFNNLLSNAIKYTPSGGTIEVFVEVDGNDAVLRVRDSGKGIAPELLTRIFDLFMQGDVSIDRSEGGMGIGLTLVRKLAELHGGTVRAFSDGRGRGSEFVVRIPRAERPQARAAGAQPEQDDDPKPRHIIVIEDNPDIRELLRAKLRHLGHTVDAAEDGQSGLEKVLESKPDVALVDIGLPALDGYELARRIRNVLGNDIYLVALTGYGQAEDRKKALDAGFDVHMTKPADLADLQNVLRGV